ncbi:glycosyltransferase family 2 protein [uncultured Amaricoccus sp.]|uniref:glycosyltransferase family 2 protein n=1 Tax=uncultured Amaricoccus sp. TaxID=339341 RepID=UPI002616AABF|nr:glycosyltransferase family 2 protein [uncultured Amaricoccus sp.]
MSPLLEIRRDPTGGARGLGLCAVVHDEMFFLPEFLRHYRALGVARFIFLDDASTDGTAEFLGDQPDCVLVGSPYRYFDKVEGARAIYAWRQALLDGFCRDQWAIFADADEFLALPAGVGVADVIARLTAAGSDSVWGVMVDLYPERITPAGPFRVDGDWFFDARPHLYARPGWKKPMTLYRGSRARLLAEHRISERKGALRAAALRLGLGGFLKVNNLAKAPLVRWTAGHRFDGSHRVVPPPTVGDILAIMHFKFAGDLGRKVAYALDTKGYEGGSRQYQLMGELLARMEAEGRDFLGRGSRRLTSPADLYAAGVGRWNA